MAAGRLDGAVARAWLALSARVLADTHAHLDALNLVPVPDSDTGTNVLLTLRGAAQAVEVPDASAHAVLVAAARGAARAARGNSGVILAQYLDGLAHGLDGAGDAAAVAAGLARAERAARAAVVDPLPGTVLDAAALAAQVAEQQVTGCADDPEDPAVLLRAVVDRVRDDLPVLARRHAVLAEAGVVDAGAGALVLLLACLEHTLAGRPGMPDTGWLAGLRRPAGHHHALSGGAFEVMGLVVGGHDDPAPALRAALAAVGDSVAVVGGDDCWQAHVHTDDPAAAVGALDVGRRREQVLVRALVVDPVPVVAVTAAVGLAESLAAAGAVVLVRCDDAPVTREHLARALVDAGGGAPLVLAGDPATAEVARALVAPERVVAAEDDLAVTVGVAACVGGGTAAVRTALARLRRAEVPAPPVGEDRTPDPRPAVAALTGLAAAVPGASAATVLVGAGVSEAGRELLAGALRACADHLGLDAVVLADGVPGARVRIGVD